MPHSQPKNWQAELGLKQMLNLGVGRDGQQQDSQCPDAAGGLCVQDSQQRQGNGQDSAGGGGGGEEQQWLGGQIRMGRQREGNGAGGTRWPASSSGLSPSHGPMELGASELPDLPSAHAP